MLASPANASPFCKNLYNTVEARNASGAALMSQTAHHDGRADLQTHRLDRPVAAISLISASTTIVRSLSSFTLVGRHRAHRPLATKCEASSTRSTATVGLSEQMSRSSISSTYTDDVDLRARLSEWEQFYNLARPHGAFNGKAPYEVLRERL